MVRCSAGTNNRHASLCDVSAETFRPPSSPNPNKPPESAMAAWSRARFLAWLLLAGLLLSGPRDASFCGTRWWTGWNGGRCTERHTAQT